MIVKACFERLCLFIALFIFFLSVCLLVKLFTLSGLYFVWWTRIFDVCLDEESNNGGRPAEREEAMPGSSGAIHLPHTVQHVPALWSLQQVAAQLLDVDERGLAPSVARADTDQLCSLALASRST